MPNSIGFRPPENRKHPFVKGRGLTAQVVPEQCNQDFYLGDLTSMHTSVYICIRIILAVADVDGKSIDCHLQYGVGRLRNHLLKCTIH